MKNANVFVDVDLTLIDSNARLLNGAREALQRLRDEGCHLFLWSTVGPDYCRKVAQIHGLTDFFEGFTAKPDIIIDDMPSTCVTRSCTTFSKSSRGMHLRSVLSRSTSIDTENHELQCF